MIVTVFRSRVRPEHAADYMKRVARMKERFYSEFSIHVCKPLRSNSFKA